MIKHLLILFLISQTTLLHAQSIKTDVLVIGGSPAAVAAAMQSARSGENTVLATDGFQIAGMTAGGATAISTNRQVPSGLWGEFRNRYRVIRNGNHPVDSSVTAPFAIEKSMAESVLKLMTDSVKKLTVDPGLSFNTIEKDGDGWSVKFLRDGKVFRVKAKAIVDGTENGLVAEKAGAKSGDHENVVSRKAPGTLFLTAIAAGDALPGAEGPKAYGYPPSPFWYIPLDALLKSGVENLFVTEALLPRDKSIQYLPAELELGQSIGAVAAYLPFFKTSARNIKVRVIQGELLDFKVYLLPFEDIPQTDPDWRAVQQVGVTGLLGGSVQKTEFNFMPDSLVKTTEIEPVLKEIYTRAFLWFGKEKPGSFFTIGNMLSLISDYSLTDPAILRNTISKAWKTQLKFTSEFEMKRPVTRREFAVLANRYLNPFARTVNLDGRFIN